MADSNSDVAAKEWESLDLKLEFTDLVGIRKLGNSLRLDRWAGEGDGHSTVGFISRQGSPRPSLLLLPTTTAYIRFGQSWSCFIYSLIIKKAEIYRIIPEAIVDTP